MVFKEIRNGMKVEIQANEHGGQFPIGSVGKVRNKCKDHGDFEVVINDEYWVYRPEEVCRPQKYKT